MPKALLEQLDRYGEDFEAGTVPVEYNSIVIRDWEPPLAPTAPPTMLTRVPGWSYALLAAAVVLLIVGGVAWLTRADTDLSPVDQPTLTTIIDSAPTQNTWLAQDIPPDVESGVIDTPKGRARWVHIIGEQGTVPNEGTVVEWPTGAAILSGWQLFVSDDMIEWNEHPLPLPSPPNQEEVGVSLTYIDGLYWLILSGHVERRFEARMWNSTNGTEWDEIDPGLLRSPSGLSSARAISPLISNGDLTLFNAEYVGPEPDFPKDRLLIFDGLEMVSIENPLDSDPNTESEWEAVNRALTAEGFPVVSDWEPSHLPSLPSTPEPQSLPDNTCLVGLPSGWFASDVSWGGCDGEQWWMHTGDTWVSLDGIGIHEVGNESRNCHVATTGIGNTTMFFHGGCGPTAPNPTHLWVLSIEPSN